MKKKINFRLDTDLIDDLKTFSEQHPNLSMTTAVEISITHFLHCTPEERAEIISKYFDPNWPPKDCS